MKVGTAMQCRFFFLVFLLVMLSFPWSVSATPIFYENFDSENGGVPRGYGYYDSLHPLSQWNILRGNVDLLGLNAINPSLAFDPLPGHGLYLDLDGVQGGARLQTKNEFMLTPGNYTISYDLASYHLSRNTVTVSIGDIYSRTITLQGNTQFNTYSDTFDVSSTTNAYLVFDQQGNDSVGLLFDTVSLEATTVPEPSTLILFLGGVGLIITRKIYSKK